jgi:hypothetical protein
MMTKADDRYRDYCHDDRHNVRQDRDYRDYRRDYDRDYGRDYSPDYGRDYARDREIIRERVVVQDRVVQDLNFCDVPGRVQDRANDYRHGRRIQFAQRVEDCGRTYYQVGICDREHGDFTLQIEQSGHLVARINR